MYVYQHVILGAIFSLILFVLLPEIGLIGVSIIFLSSFLIDVDHYLYHCLRKNDLSLKNAYKTSMKKTLKFISLPREKRNKIYCGFHCLHGIEFLLVLFLFSIFGSGYFFFIFLGASFHLLLDIIHGTIYIDRVDKASVIFDFYKYKKLEFFEA